MIKLTSDVETVLVCIYSDFMLSGTTVSRPPCWGGSSKSLLSTSLAGCLPERTEIKLFWICISRRSRGSVVFIGLHGINPSSNHAMCQSSLRTLRLRLRDLSQSFNF